MPDEDEPSPDGFEWRAMRIDASFCVCFHLPLKILIIAQVDDNWLRNKPVTKNQLDPVFPAVT